MAFQRIIIRINYFLTINKVNVDNNHQYVEPKLDDLKKEIMNVIFLNFIYFFLFNLKKYARLKKIKSKFFNLEKKLNLILIEFILFLFSDKRIDYLILLYFF